MKIKTLAFAIGIFCGAVPALATTRPKALPAAQAEVPESGRENIEYQRAIARIESQRRKGIALSAATFHGFNWVGRTAAINYACSTMPLEACRTLLEAGIEDRALFVRDHSLKVILASEKYLWEEKKLYAQKVIDDERNYRGGVALWIVERAKKYLGTPKG